MHKLYHYVHCPFCVRVRMAMGKIGVDFDSIVLPYNDEKTPIALTKVKMLPIMTFSYGSSINESLEIIKKLDSENSLSNELAENNQEVQDLLSQIGSPTHNLAMPYWIHTPEFNAESRDYFITKKSKNRGPFKDLVKRRHEFMDEVHKTLKSLDECLSPYYKSQKLTIIDIMIASHLWGLYVVPEFQFSQNIHNYLMTIKEECNFNYHEDFWK